MIQTVKKSEQARQEYRFMSGFEMDAREEGIQQGIEQGIQQGLRQGIQQGKSLGLAEGSRQKALETARILKQLGDSVKKIIQATGLSKEEVEAIN